MSLSQRPPAIKQALPGIQNPTIKPVPGAAISSSLDSFQKLRPDELGNMVTMQRIIHLYICISLYLYISISCHNA